MYGGGKPEALLTRDYGKDWDIAKYLSIKLRPGSHPYSSMVEASINAAREANVPASQIAKILVDRRNLLGAPLRRISSTLFTVWSTTSPALPPTRTSTGCMPRRRNFRIRRSPG